MELRELGIGVQCTFSIDSLLKVCKHLQFTIFHDALVDTILSENGPLLSLFVATDGLNKNYIITGHGNRTILFSSCQMKRKLMYC